MRRVVLDLNTTLVMIQSTVIIDFPRNRKDSPFLVRAESGKADYLITGDTDFSEASTLISATICSPLQFAQTVEPQLLTGR